MPPILIKKRKLTVLLGRVILSYLIFAIGILTMNDIFNFAIFVAPVIIFGINFWSTKDRYALYFLNLGALFPVVFIFFMALFNTSNAVAQAAGMIFTIAIFLEFSIIILCLDKIRIAQQKKRGIKYEDKIQEDKENEKMEIGLLGVKIIILIAIIFFIFIFLPGAFSKR